MADYEPFTMVEEPDSHRLYDRYQDLTAARTADHDIQYQAKLRHDYPELILTTIPGNNCNLLAFAAAGHATAALDNNTEPSTSWRGWVPAIAIGEKGRIGQSTFFALYQYTWSGEDFILYIVGGMQYLLKEPRQGETITSPSKLVDALITSVGTWQNSDQEVVWVYDSYWTKSKPLWEQVQKAEWDSVILDEGMKTALQEVTSKFFENRKVYEDLGVPWKRGIMFYGPAGNGKTVSLKALIHTLLRHHPPIPTLYIKSAPNVYHIRNIFTFARRMSPCMLVFEDIDTIVTANTRSYFFNEVDGLENNDGILMVASTNHLDKLDPGLSKRPSRFDRKYLFPLPSEHERVLYCNFWRHKLRKNPSIEFPIRLSLAIAALTEDFSFAYLQEAFVASLLVIAREENNSYAPLHAPDDGSEDPGDHLEDVELWRVIKQQIKTLREDMDSSVKVTDEADSRPSDAIPRSSGHAAGRASMRAMRHERSDPQAGFAAGQTGEETRPVTQSLEALALNHSSGRIGTMMDVSAVPEVGMKGAYINTAAYDYRP